MTTTQLRDDTSPPVVTFDSIKVSLLVTPAIGYSQYLQHALDAISPLPHAAEVGPRRRTRQRR